MNCLFCHNEVHPNVQKDNGYRTGWCNHCPIPVFYSWWKQKPNEDYTQIINTQLHNRVPDNRIPDNNPYYIFTIEYNPPSTSLMSISANKIEELMTCDKVLDISPNNFFNKLKTYLVFS